MFELFDFNERNYLEEIDLEFLVHTSISACMKIFSIGGMGTSVAAENTSNKVTDET